MGARAIDPRDGLEGSTEAHVGGHGYSSLSVCLSVLLLCSLASPKPISIYTPLCAKLEFVRHWNIPQKCARK